MPHVSISSEIHEAVLRLAGGPTDSFNEALEVVLAQVQRRSAPAQAPAVTPPPARQAKVTRPAVRR